MTKNTAARSAGTSLRIAAVGDLHLHGSDADDAVMRPLMDAVVGHADVLLLCGDLTAHGRPPELKHLLQGIRRFEGPVLAVLGNHDHEADRHDHLADLLEKASVAVLEGHATTIHGVGFAGAKGFGGGFGRGQVEAFGERSLKSFVEAIIDETGKLEDALRGLDTPRRVVVTHYSPAVDTLAGEPEMIWPFLGSSRLATLIDAFNISAVFHGHAHLGSPEGTTPCGVPVFNVALPVLLRHEMWCRFWTAPAAADDASADTELAGSEDSGRRRQ